MTKTHTNAVTNTRLLIATLALVGAAGLAFAITPAPSSPSGGAVAEWEFDSEADYLFDSSKIELAGGAARLKTVDQTDNSASEFASGTFANTEWNSGSSTVVLSSAGKAAGSGSFTSRVFDAAVASAWSSLTPVPLSPFGKELPNNAGVETGYASGNIDMTGNTLLTHLNSSYAESGNVLVADSSGNGNNGILNDYGWVKYTLTAAMLTQDGLGAFSAANSVDEDIGTSGWHTDTATSGAWLLVDLGEGNTMNFTKWKLWTGSNSTNYTVQYSDNGADWQAAATDFIASLAGWNEKQWVDVGSHRYWRLYAVSVVGGSWLNETELWYRVANENFSTGKLNRALTFDGQQNYVSFANNASLNFGSDSFTYMIWVNPSSSVGAFDMPIYKGGSVAVNPGYDMELGVSGWAGHISDGSVIKAASLGSTMTGSWAHLALVIDRTENKFKSYRNGELLTEVDIAGFGLVDNALDLYLSKPTHKFAGRMDELALFRRALTAAEVQSIYERGATRLKYQVRSCDDSVCDGESFAGPGGSDSAYYNELLNNTLSPPTFSLSGAAAANQYFQYKVFYETDDANLSPSLSSIAIGPGRYPTDNPTIVNVNPAPSYNLLGGFGQALGGENAGAVKYQVSANSSTWYYWDGSAWSVGSGYEQTNTAAEVNANLSEFDSVATGTFYWKAFLHAPTSGDQVELSGLAVGYLTDGFAINAPLASSTVSVGTSLNITWNYYGGAGETVNIRSDNGDGSGYDYEITPNSSIGSGGAGSFNWATVPASEQGNNVKIKICSNEYPSVCSETNPFRVVPTILLTSPDGGETWGALSTRSITWAATGTVATATVSYSTDSGSSWTTIVNCDSIPNSGTCEWTLPDIASATTVRVKVQSSADASVNDMSDADFGIFYYTVTWNVKNASNNHLTDLSVSDSSGWSTSSLSSPLVHQYPFGVHNTIWSKAGYQSRDVNGWTFTNPETLTLEKNVTLIAATPAPTPPSGGGGGAYIPTPEVAAGVSYDVEADTLRAHARLNIGGVGTISDYSMGGTSTLFVFNGSGNVIYQSSTSTQGSGGVFWHVWSGTQMSTSVRYYAQMQIGREGRVFESNRDYDIIVPVRAELPTTVVMQPTSTEVEASVENNQSGPGAAPLALPESRSVIANATGRSRARSVTAARTSAPRRSASSTASASGRTPEVSSSTLSAIIDAGISIDKLEKAVAEEIIEYEDLLKNAELILNEWDDKSAPSLAADVSAVRASVYRLRSLQNKISANDDGLSLSLKVIYDRLAALQSELSDGNKSKELGAVFRGLAREIRALPMALSASPEFALKTIFSQVQTAGRSLGVRIDHAEYGSLEPGQNVDQYQGYLTRLRNRLADARAALTAVQQLATRKSKGPVVETYMTFNSVEVNVLAVNPYNRTSTVQVRMYMPKEVRLSHIMDTGKMELSYDEQMNGYVAAGSIAVGPRQTAKRKIELSDVWYVRPDVLAELKSQANSIFTRVARSPFAAHAAILKNEVTVNADMVLARQSQSYVSPDKHILAFRENKERLTLLRGSLNKLQTLDQKVETLRQQGAIKRELIKDPIMPYLALVALGLWVLVVVRVMRGRS